MRKVSLAKALKLKNKKVNRLNTLAARIHAHNSYMENNKPTYDAQEVYEEYLKEMNQLVELKSKIMEANLPINNLVLRQGELKNFISKMRGVPTLEGETNRWRDESAQKFKAAISAEKRDSMVETMESDIEMIQDALDKHNINTEIELTF